MKEKSGHLIAQTIWQKMRGQMFRLNPKPMKFIDVDDKEFIHMLFVFTKLKVEFYDKKNKLISTDVLYPFISFRKIPSGTKTIIEIPIK